jgi:hypothetical protein
MRSLTAFCLVLALVSPLARADSPLPPPQTIIACSPSGMVCANSDPLTNRTVVSRKNGPEAPWSINGWHRWLFVADDGHSAVVGYAGMNLVPIQSDLQLEVLYFYKQSKLVRTIKLADLYRDKSQLVRTVSHLAWVRSIRVNRANQLVLELVSGRNVAFGMSTGDSQPEVRDGA